MMEHIYASGYWPVSIDSIILVRIKKILRPMIISAFSYVHSTTWCMAVMNPYNS